MIKRVFIIVLVISIAGVLLGFNFNSQAWINYISENCVEVSINTFIKDAKSFPDFGGGVFDKIADIGKMIYYPVLLIYDGLIIVIEMLNNFIVILGGVLSGVAS